MDMDGFLINEPVNIVSLERLAAHSVALQIWYSYVSRMFELPAQYQSDCEKIIELLSMPQLIENKLKTCLNDLLAETRKWLKHYERPIFFENSTLRHCKPMRRENIFRCAWSWDCRIDHIQTAVNLLAASGFNDVQKFIILCRYCMVDRIQEIQLDSLRPYAHLLRRDPLYNYWYRFLNGELLTWSSPAHDPGVENSILNAIDECYLDLIRYTISTGYQIAFNYFWDSADDAFRTEYANELFPLVLTHPDFQFAFLSRLSASKQRELISERPNAIIVQFIIENKPENALLCWKNTKNTMIEYRFYRLICSLIGQLQLNHVEECTEFLLHIWEDASVRQKNYTAYLKPERIVDLFFCENYVPSKQALRFFFRFLSRGSPEFRRQMLFRNVAKFTVEFPLYEHLTRNLLNLCLPTDDDRSEFQALMSTSIKGFRELLPQNTREVAEKLRIFFNDNTDAIRLFVRELLEVPCNTYANLLAVDFNNRWREFSQFVDTFFQTSEAVKLKENFIRVLVRENCAFCWSSFGFMENLIQAVTPDLSSQNLEHFLRVVLHDLRFIINKRENVFFEREEFAGNLKWFLRNEEAVRAFLNDMPEGAFSIIV